MGLTPITVNTAAEAPAHIYAEDDAAIYQALFGGDCVANIGDKLKTTVLSNNKVRVGDGVIVLGGHIGRNKYGSYQDMTINNGVSGKNRNDLIVAKFLTTGSGGIDTYTLEVKQGVAGTTGTDPAVTQGDLYKGATLREFPLYRVKLEGLSIVKVEQLFEICKTNKDLSYSVSELNSKLSSLTTAVGNVKMHRNSFTKASQGDYLIVYSAAEIRAIFGEYDKSKLHVSITNGDGDAVATHFYSPECWSSGVYAYFYPPLNNGVSVRVNVDMTYKL